MRTVGQSFGAFREGCSGGGGATSSASDPLLEAKAQEGPVLVHRPIRASRLGYVFREGVTVVGCQFFMSIEVKKTQTQTQKTVAERTLYQIAAAQPVRPSGRELALIQLEVFVV